MRAGARARTIVPTRAERVRNVTPTSALALAAANAAPVAATSPSRQARRRATPLIRQPPSQRSRGAGRPGRGPAFLPPAYVLAGRRRCVCTANPAALTATIIPAMSATSPGLGAQSEGLAETGAGVPVGCASIPVVTSAGVTAGSWTTPVEISDGGAGGVSAVDPVVVSGGGGRSLETPVRPVLISEAVAWVADAATGVLPADPPLGAAAAAADPAPIAAMPAATEITASFWRMP